jgi:hypothetical protein
VELLAEEAVIVADRTAREVELATRLATSRAAANSRTVANHVAMGRAVDEQRQNKASLRRCPSYLPGCDSLSIACVPGVACASNYTQVGLAETVDCRNLPREASSAPSTAPTASIGATVYLKFCIFDRSHCINWCLYIRQFPQHGTWRMLC